MNKSAFSAHPQSNQGFHMHSGSFWIKKLGRQNRRPWSDYMDAYAVLGLVNDTPETVCYHFAKGDNFADKVAP